MLRPHTLHRVLRYIVYGIRHNHYYFMLISPDQNHRSPQWRSRHQGEMNLEQETCRTHLQLHTNLNFPLTLCYFEFYAPILTNIEEIVQD